MALKSIFSRRKRLKNKADADVYIYDQMSQKLRMQACYVFHEAADKVSGYDIDKIYAPVVKEMRKELGVTSLITLKGYQDYHGHNEFDNWFVNEKNVDFLCDAIELFITYCWNIDRQYGGKHTRNMVEELNARMLEDCFGYQIEGGQIIELGSAFTHQEVVVPALHLLSNSRFKNVDEEFREAHREFREGNYEDCIHDCCNAFESMIKIIAAEKKWSGISAKSAAKDLVKAVFDNGLIPAYMQNEFTGLRTILESGINTVRNQAGGHGQGAVARRIDKQVAEFQLNQTAAAIKLLADYA